MLEFSPVGRIGGRVTGDRLDPGKTRQRGKLQGQYTIVKGLSIYDRRSEDIAPPGAPAVILVHGAGLSGRYMVPTGEQLAPDYRVYIPDLPGYGDSDKPEPPLDLSGLADSLCRWMDATGIQQAAMLGNSFGCQIIVEFAVRHPERLERAILQGPTVDRSARTFGQQLWRLILDAPYEASSQAGIQIEDYQKAGFRRILQTFNLAISDAIEEKLPCVRVPTLVVRGEKDPVVPYEWAREVFNLLPDAQYVEIAGGGHTLNYKEPVAVARVARAFLSGTQSHGQKEKEPIR
ncbi:alpha/beta hydrolase [Lyngbya sp. CCY1209]|uniref:alpha/beta fold hydrolase n=1 Tax=Lyngbya sp. CCY1209 TaxID=2886103 RepID=UPI002D215E3A|nr:alpha/beta hydrolase [Lyngbya sp. CCY1209]MEB3885852.1 alpha/beta hydrolase [Lyngbya sp. CCY1209]